MGSKMRMKLITKLEKKKKKKKNHFTGIWIWMNSFHIVALLQAQTAFSSEHVFNSVYKVYIYAKKMKNEEETRIEGKMAIELEIKLIHFKVPASVPTTTAAAVVKVD